MLAGRISIRVGVFRDAVLFALDIKHYRPLPARRRYDG
jgi:hypothetical protein